MQTPTKEEIFYELYRDIEVMICNANHFSINEKEEKGLLKMLKAFDKFYKFECKCDDCGEIIEF